MNSSSESRSSSSTQGSSCCGGQSGAACGCGRGRPSGGALSPLRLVLALAGLVAWWLVYRHLAAFAAWLTYSLFGLERGSHLGASVEFFLYDTPKVLMLLVLVVFGVGVIRTFFTPERTRRLLAGRRESWAMSLLRCWASSRRSARARPCRCSSASSPLACRWA
jgi:hypothetical protein